MGTKYSMRKTQRKFGWTQWTSHFCTERNGTHQILHDAQSFLRISDDFTTHLFFLSTCTFESRNIHSISCLTLIIILEIFPNLDRNSSLYQQDDPGFQCCEQKLNRKLYQITSTDELSC